MIEIYVVTALGPIPLATMGSSEWRSTGQNYLKSLLALGFQAFLIMIVVGIYAVLIRNISGAADIAGASGAAWAIPCCSAFVCSRPAASASPYSVPIEKGAFEWRM